MSVNTLGKLLVMLHVSFSMLALTWAASVYLQFTDWGWKEPRTDLGQRVPSEYVKRAAALKESLRARDLVYYTVKPAQANLREAEDRFPTNSLWYDSILAEMKSSAADKIEVKEIKYTGGVLDLDTPGKAVGKPVLENPVPGVEKSLALYQEDLKKIFKESDVVTVETRKWVQEAKEITKRLTGLAEDGKRDKTGLYDLLIVETRNQAQAKFEMDYLQPLWVDALKEAELYRERRERLDDALRRVKKIPVDD